MRRLLPLQGHEGRFQRDSGREGLKVNTWSHLCHLKGVISQKFSQVFDELVAKIDDEF